MPDEKLKAQYQDIADRQAAKQTQFTDLSPQFKPAGYDLETQEKEYKQETLGIRKGGKDYATLVAEQNNAAANFTAASLVDIYIFLWKLFAACVAFALPFGLIYVLIANAH